MKAGNFLKNPVVLFAHKYDEMPIAKCVDLQTTEQGILATVQFLEEGVYDKSDIIYRMYKEGFLNAWSIGFSADDYDQNEFGGYTFKSWELFEFSSVPVPDNPGALTVMRSKGINVDALFEKGKPVDTPEPKEEKKEAKPEQKPEEKQEAQLPNAADTEKKGEAAEDKKEQKQPEPKALTDETVVADLTVAQLKELITPPVVEQKDISEVTSLACVLSELQWIAWCFEDSEVSQPTMDKLNQAIALILEAIKDQAELGKKSFAMNDTNLKDVTPEERAKLVAWSIEKAGRTISAKHEGLLKEACDHMTNAADKVKSVLDTVAEQVDEKPAEDDKSVTIPNPFLQKLANSLKTNNQKQDLTLRLLKQIQSEKGGENNEQTN